MSTRRKPPSSAFKPGQSGNPKGRPRGSLNKTTKAVLALMEGEAEEITRAAIGAAKGGDMTAVRLILDRLVPTVKERTVALPGLPDTTTAAGIASAQQHILEAVAIGALTPGEASTLAGIIEARRKAMETQELEERLSALEGKQP